MTSQYRIEVRCIENDDKPAGADACARVAPIIAELLMLNDIPTFTIELIEVISNRSERVLSSYARAAGGELAAPMEP